MSEVPVKSDKPRVMHKCADGRIIPVMTNEEFRALAAEEKVMRAQGWRPEGELTAIVSIIAAYVIGFGLLVGLFAIWKACFNVYGYRRLWWW